MTPPGTPSPWFEQHREELAAAARRGPILDLACGGGRHAAACAERGWSAVGIDRNARLLTGLRDATRPLAAPTHCIRADLEAGHGLPISPGRCAAVLVFRYLFRPLAAAIEEALAPGGLLLYETFTLAQRELPAGPRRADFLLAPGELPTLFPGLDLLASGEQTRQAGEMIEAVAFIAARRPIG